MTSHIRIPDVSPVAQALADGARSVFPFSFPIFQAGDIEVRANSILVAAGYTVVGEGSSTGGAVIFADAPASGVRITLRRRQTYARTDDFLDERTPTPHQLNDAVDRNVAALQELDEQVSRSVRRSLSADLSQPLDLTLPAPEAGKAIGWNGSADALVNLAQADVSDFLRKSQNLADLPDTAVARGNLGLGSAALRAEGDFATAAQGARADGALQSSDIGNSVQAHDAALDWLAGNLGDAGKALLDDADPAAQRATLGLVPVASSGWYSDLSGRPTLGSAAALDVDADGTLAANADSRLATQKAVKTYVDGKVSVTQADALLKAQNLADLPDTAVARGNLGLGSAALRAEGDFATAAQGARADGALQSSDIGNSVQAHDAALDWLAGNLGDAGKALLDDADPAAQRATLGLGSAATKDVGTGANQVVALDAAGHLPAVNGSAVTSLDAGNLTSGSVAAARLGSGTADGSTFLRGDGTWATLAGIGGSAFGNVQIFTSSGTFTVPANVTKVLVMAIGGGGGGGNLGGQIASPGGVTSFGSLVASFGGSGGYINEWGSGFSGGLGSGSVGSNALGVASYSATTSYGRGGTGNRADGGPGGHVLALAFVTPGEAITVVIGSGGGGTGGGLAGYSGVVVVRY